MEKGPGRLVTAPAQHQLHSQSAGSVLLAGHLPDRPQPGAQRQAAVLKDRAGRYRGLMTAGTADQSATLRQPSLLPPTAGTAKALWPSQPSQIRPALFLGGEALLQFQERLGVVFNHPALLHLGVGGVNR